MIWESCSLAFDPRRKEMSKAMEIVPMISISWKKLSKYCLSAQPAESALNQREKKYKRDRHSDSIGIWLSLETAEQQWCLQRRCASVIDNATSSTVKSTMLMDMIKSVQTWDGRDMVIARKPTLQVCNTWIDWQWLANQKIPLLRPLVLNGLEWSWMVLTLPWAILSPYHKAFLQMASGCPRMQGSEDPTLVEKSMSFAISGKIKALSSANCMILSTQITPQWMAGKGQHCTIIYDNHPTLRALVVVYNELATLGKCQQAVWLYPFYGMCCRLFLLQLRSEMSNMSNMLQFSSWNV